MTLRQVILRGSMFKGIAVKYGIVQNGGKQVVCAFHRREIVCEMEIDVIDRMNAGKSATGRPAFDAENRPQGWLPQGRNGGFADFCQGLRKPDGYGRLSFPGRSRCHGRYQN